jgi:tetratricopeptide (TPR) repeat protein
MSTRYDSGGVNAGWEPFSLVGEPQLGVRESAPVMNMARSYRVWLLALAFAFLPLQVMLCQQIPKAEKHYQLGLDLEKAGKYHEAAKEFSLAIQINPEFREAYHHLGFSAFQDGDVVRAIHALMQLIQLEPTNNQTRLALAQIYSDLGYSDDALALYIRAQQVAPEDPEICFHIGLIYFERKDYSQAVQDLQQAIALDPRMIKAHRLLASVYEAQSDLPNAYRQLREAAEAAPRDPDPPSDLGMLYLKEGKLAEAEKQFLKAVSLQENFEPARVGLAKTYRLMGRLPESLEQLSSVFREAPEDPPALLERGSVEEALGKKDEARADFEHFSRIAPEHAEGEISLGILDFSAGHYSTAIQHLSKAVVVDAKQPQAYYFLGQAYYHLGKSKEAEDALRHCLSLDPAHKAAGQLLEQVLKVSPRPQ